MHLQISSDRLELSTKVKKIISTKFTPKLDQLLSRFNEELKTAMQREAREEVGLDLALEDLELAHVMHRFCGDHERVDFFFTCHHWQGEPKNCEEDKCAELRWVPLDNLPDDVIDYYQQAFDHIRRGEVYSAFGWNE